MDGWIDRQVRTDKSKWIDRWMDGWMDRQVRTDKSKWIDRWMDGWIDRQTDRQMDGQIDRWMIDRQIYRQMNRFFGWLRDGYKQTIGYMYIRTYHVVLAYIHLISSTYPSIHLFINSAWW